MFKADEPGLFRKHSTALLIIFGTLLIDLTTKGLVHSFLAPGDLIVVIPGFFNLSHVLNPGAAFGMLSSLAPHVRQVFFGVVTILATVLFSLQLKNCSSTASKEYFAYSLIIGGGLGNATNRLALGHVVDFYDFHWNNAYHYPSFNIADVAICTGAALLFLEHLRSWRRQLKRYP